jgi:site-specific DNA-methyltransferase (adenine-specific)
MLPQELFKNPDTKFLDPACKSGVFLREIAKRLIKGLEPQFPDLQERIDHIFHCQLYGIAITELTSLLSRRSVYCSKFASSDFSVSKFKNPDGNIRYKRIPHAFQEGKCIYCGANSGQYDRSEELETHAYEFIHTVKPEEIFNMKFDVIIGNPPYQLSTAGDDNGAQATPIYQKFVTQALKLNSRYVIMITPSRWFAGGWGLDDFRNLMIGCNHIKEIHDFQNSADCFNGVEIKGGVSYFVYDKYYLDKCNFYSHDNHNGISLSKRYLRENNCEILIRYNELISLYRKTSSNNKVPFSSIVSGRSPFGFNTNHMGNIKKEKDTDLLYFERSGIKYMPLDRVARGNEFIKKYKLFTAKAAEDGKLPGKVIGNITRGLPNMICSGTYLMIGPFDNEVPMLNCESYMKTKFFRALVAINKISQNASYKVYDAVPMQDFSKPWTDEELYKKYNLTQEEIDFIESMIRPME